MYSSSATTSTCLVRLQILLGVAPFSREISGYSFDYVPTFYIADLLLHEAHRHPYIERFAQMCLFAIRDEQFGNRAGAAWRQLFVCAFWPSLRCWRVRSPEETNDPLLLAKGETETIDEGIQEISNLGSGREQVSHETNG